MALVRTDLTPVSSQASGPRSWSYDTPDLLSVVEGTGYFDSAADILKDEDRIFVLSDSGGTPDHSIHVVTSIVLGVVTISASLQFAARDPANPDTAAAPLATLETEVNELKATLRKFGLIAP